MYHIINASRGLSFTAQLSEVDRVLRVWLGEEEKRGRRLVYCKVFLSDILNQYQSFIDSSLYREVLEPVNSTIVGQTPAAGTKIAMLASSAAMSEMLFHPLRLTEAEAFGQSSYLQTLLLFDRYLKLMAPSHLAMKDHLVRTWIYVADIDVNYEGVVRARNDVFRRYGLTADTHYVASTGIGGYTSTRHATVGIDFLTCPTARPADFFYLQALDHLNPTHDYGVAFERGTRLQLGGGQQFYISGTASIDRHGNILYPGDVLRQTQRLLENIGALLANGGARWENVNYFIVYLRDFSDFTVVNEYLSDRFPCVPFIILHAKVCRPGWLIEMECSASRFTVGLG